MTDDRALSRRALLLAGGAVTVSLAGCSGGSDTTPANQSDESTDASSNGDDTNTSQPGADPADGTRQPDPQVTAQFLAPSGEALEVVRLGDRTAAEAARTQTVQAMIETNRVADYSVTIDDDHSDGLPEGSVDDGRRTAEFTLQYGRLLSQMDGPGTHSLGLTAGVATEAVSASDTVDLSLAPPGIEPGFAGGGTADGSDTIALGEGEAVTLRPRFDTIVDTAYHPDISYEVTVGGEAIAPADGGYTISYDRVADLLGEAFDPSGETTVTVTGETGHGKQATTQRRLPLSLAALSGVLEGVDGELNGQTVGPEGTLAGSIADQSEIAEYTLQIQRSDGDNWRRDVDEEFELGYDRLLEELGAGEYTLQLRAATSHQTTVVDTADLTVEQPGPERRYDANEHWHEYLDIIPGDGTVEPGELTLNNMEIIRGEIPEQLLENDLFAPDSEGVGLPMNISSDINELFIDGLETQIVNSGQSTTESGNYVLDIQVYDESVEEEVTNNYHQLLSQRETRRGVEILEEDRYHQISDEFDWVVAPVQFGDKFLNVRGEYEGVKNVIDTVRGSKESIQGQVGLTYEADGETRPNEFLQNHLILTLAGHYDAPQHLNLQGEFGLDGDIPAEGEFHAAIFEDGEFEEMVVDPDENGGYETHHRIEGASPSFIGERYRGT